MKHNQHVVTILAAVVGTLALLVFTYQPDSRLVSASYVQADDEYETHLPLIMRGDEAPPPSTEPSPTPTPPTDEDIRSGEGTFYGATGAGNCSFDPTSDNLMVAAMNETDYGNAELCGAFVEATGPQGTVVVRIVDRCPECQPGDIDFSRGAFERIANPVDGRVPISWRIVSPEIDGPIVYRFKEGSNPYWTAVQIRNHRNPIATFEYLDDNGQFKAVPRERYNYFVDTSGMGPGPYTFRITDSYGNTLTDSNIVFVESGEVSGNAQFPAP
ncbi:MAG: expansin EXLX1 family cellulose-binding protein [Chloroflexota bacterium]